MAVAIRPADVMSDWLYLTKRYFLTSGDNEYIAFEKDKSFKSPEGLQFVPFPINSTTYLESTHAGLDCNAMTSKLFSTLAKEFTESMAKVGVLQKVSIAHNDPNLASDVIVPSIGTLFTQPSQPKAVRLLYTLGFTLAKALNTIFTFRNLNSKSPVLFPMRAGRVFWANLLSPMENVGPNHIARKLKDRKTAVAKPNTLQQAQSGANFSQMVHSIIDRIKSGRQGPHESDDVPLVIKQFVKRLAGSTAMGLELFESVVYPKKGEHGYVFLDPQDPSALKGLPWTEKIVPILGQEASGYNWMQYCKDLTDQLYNDDNWAFLLIRAGFLAELDGNLESQLRAMVAHRWDEFHEHVVGVHCSSFHQLNECLVWEHVNEREGDKKKILAAMSSWDEMQMSAFLEWATGTASLPTSCDIIMKFTEAWLPPMKPHAHACHRQVTIFPKVRGQSWQVVMDKVIERAESDTVQRQD